MDRGGKGASGATAAAGGEDVKDLVQEAKEGGREGETSMGGAALPGIPAGEGEGDVPMPPPGDPPLSSLTQGAKEPEAPESTTKAEAKPPEPDVAIPIFTSGPSSSPKAHADEWDVFDEEPDPESKKKSEKLTARDLKLLKSSTRVRGLGKGKKKRKLVWLNPKGAVRARWDAVVVVCILYNSIVLPLRITFGSGGDIASPLSIVDYFIDVLFVIDIILNFNTGFDDDGTVVMDQEVVRFHYFWTWFSLDLVSTIPFDLLLFIIDPGAEGDTRLYLRLPRLLRLLRLPRMFRYLNRWEDLLPVNAVALRMIKLIFSVFMFAHMNACMQMLIAELQSFPVYSWVARANLTNAPPATQYSHAAFRALSHMLCIGYGQEPPYTIVEYWLVIFSMMVGAMFYALLLGMMPTLMLSMDISGSIYTQRVDIWRQYFNYRGLTKELRTRILNYYEYRWHTKKVFDEAGLLSKLSTCLRTDIQMHVCEELIRKAPIFHALQPHIVTAVVSYMEPIKITNDEYVYNEGDLSDAMYFIQSGEISIENNDGVVFTTLSDGSYFGEFSFLYTDNKTRTACAKATKLTELFILYQRDFEVLTKAFPELLELLINIADARTAIFMAQKEEDENQQQMECEGKRRVSSNGEKVMETKASSANSAMKVIDKIKKRGLLSHITLNPDGEKGKLSMASTFAASQRLNQLNNNAKGEKKRKSRNRVRNSTMR